MRIPWYIRRPWAVPGYIRRKRERDAMYRRMVEVLNRDRSWEEALLKPSPFLKIITDPNTKWVRDTTIRGRGE